MTLSCGERQVESPFKPPRCLRTDGDVVGIHPMLVKEEPRMLVNSTRILAARALCKISTDELAKLCELPQELLEDIENEKTAGTPIVSERIISELETLGCYFEFQNSRCTGVELYSYEKLQPAENSPSEISELYAIDARTFLRSAMVLDKHKRPEDEHIVLFLPLVFLCCHCMELSLKSYVLRKTNDSSSTGKPKGLRMQKTHDLLWLLDRCRKYGCEELIELSDLDYEHMRTMASIHASFSNRYREGQAPNEQLMPEALLALTRKICRYSKPPMYYKDKIFDAGRGPLILTFNVPARPTRKKPSPPSS
jgi:hypothetical protein